jgi:hypothetical protein
MDPRHFGTDPDPGIHTTDLRIRILRFPSVADKMSTKKNFLQSVFASKISEI